jgi:hypothetical protein
MERQLLNESNSFDKISCNLKSGKIKRLPSTKKKKDETQNGKQNVKLKFQYMSIIL